MSGPGMQAEQPEQPRRRVGQVVVRPRQHRPYAAGRLAGVQGVQPAWNLGAVRPAQLGGEPGEGEVWGGGGAGRHDRQRQRQPGAAGDDLCGRLRLGGQALRTDPAGEQRPGVRVVQQIKAQRMGALTGDQAGELLAAGDQ
jgi:hypothetical protein